MTVPALMWLWSDWDVALPHFRRYSRRALLNLVAREHFDVAHCAYINVVALLPVMLVRPFRALTRSAAPCPEPASKTGFRLRRAMPYSNGRSYSWPANGWFDSPRESDSWRC